MIITDLTIVKGDTFPYNFVYKYRDGRPVNLTSFEVYGLVKSTEASATSLDHWTVENGKLQIFPTEGRVRIYLTPAQTEYEFNTAVWALVVRHESFTFDKTISKGKVIITTGGNRWARP